MSHQDLRKSDLRADVKRRLAAMTAAELATASEALCRMIASRISPASLTGPVFAFVPIAGEPAILPLLHGLLEAGVDLALPRIDWPSRSIAAAMTPSLEGLVQGRLGLLEPPPDAVIVDPADLAIVLVPGLAFDRAGGRLGRGGGFYDRFLPSATTARRIGICFDTQMVNAVPIEPHDVLMHEVVTERTTLGNPDNYRRRPDLADG